MIDYDDIPDPVVRVPIKVDPYKPVIISKEAYDKLPDYEKQYYEEWGKPCTLLGPKEDDYIGELYTCAKCKSIVKETECLYNADTTETICYKCFNKGDKL